MDWLDEATFADIPNRSETDLMLLRSLRILNVEVQWLSGMCPVQAEGLVENLPFYFRARGEHWSFSLDETPGDVGGDPVGVGCGYKQGWHLAHRYGDFPDAGYMPNDHVLLFIGYAVAEWRSQREIQNAS